MLPPNKYNGKEVAIAEAEKLNLKDSPFYFALLGDQRTIQKKIDGLSS